MTVPVLTVTSVRGSATKTVVADPRRIAPDVEARVLELYQQPETRVNDIAAEVGLSRSSVYWVLQKHGVTPDRIRRPEREVRHEASERYMAQRAALLDDELRAIITHQHAENTALIEELGMLRARLRMMGRIYLAISEGRMSAEESLVTVGELLDGFLPGEQR